MDLAGEYLVPLSPTTPLLPAVFSGSILVFTRQNWMEAWMCINVRLAYGRWSSARLQTAASRLQELGHRAQLVVDAPPVAAPIQQCLISEQVRALLNEKGWHVHHSTGCSSLLLTGPTQDGPAYVVHLAVHVPEEHWPLLAEVYAERMFLRPTGVSLGDL